MSDDAPAFYNTWSGVMGNVKHQLLCSWHSLKKRNLFPKHCVSYVHQTSVQDFQNHLSKFIEDLMSDDDTKAFGIYFEKYYARRTKLWAYCFRFMLGINTNMYLESFHKILKHIYSEERKVKRLDKTINALMKICRDSVISV
ncbi:MULE domain-containing protein [Aphis craccivora]|uniref:MULE domain-containing protein n=1 Tax=Aphis craccivora TaxID=307492 RepID=A0A6G0YH15_APHCR|nr:MULE domain-containing protein [Aphis craccivora]